MFFRVSLGEGGMQGSMRLWGFAIIMCMVLLTAAPLAMAQASDTADIRVGQHQGYVRVVFDFPKLVAYYVTESEKGVQVKFDTPLNATAPGKLPAPIGAMEVYKPDSQTLIADITAPGAQVK